MDTRDLAFSLKEILEESDTWEKNKNLSAIKPSFSQYYRMGFRWSYGSFIDEADFTNEFRILNMLNDLGVK
jgi:hypothetical protein